MSPKRMEVQLGVFLICVMCLDLVLSVQEEEQLANLLRSSPMMRTKKSPILSESLTGSHCLDNFEVNEKLIIRMNDSIDLGAVFLNATELDTFKFCLKYCCETPLCNTAVWDQKSGSCFLFDCGSPDDFYCLFDPINTYMSGVLMVDRHAFESISRAHNEKHENQLQTLGFNDGPLQVVPKKGYASKPRVTCGTFQFACRNGVECVAVYDTCNSIPQCSDGSDEDPEQCPGTSTVIPPPAFPPRQQNVPPNQPAITHPRPDVMPRPASIDQWGREGERYVPQQQQEQQQQTVQPQSMFQHQTSGILPNGMMMGQPSAQQQQKQQQQQQRLPPGFWPNGGQVQFPYGYNQGPRVDYSNNFGYGFAPNANPEAKIGEYYPNNFNVQTPQQFTPQPAVPPAKSKTDLESKKENQKGTTKKPMTTTSLPPTKPDHLIKQEFKTILIEDLKDEDFIMETPAAAVFTLVVGVILSALLAILLVCRVRTLRRRGRKRNVSADADGDYLVNGMYL